MFEEIYFLNDNPKSSAATPILETVNPVDMIFLQISIDEEFHKLPFEGFFYFLSSGFHLQSYSICARIDTGNFRILPLFMGKAIPEVRMPWHEYHGYGRGFPGAVDYGVLGCHSFSEHDTYIALP